MSARGHSPTCRLVIAMSAIPSKAGVDQSVLDIGSGPCTDIVTFNATLGVNSAVAALETNSAQQLALSDR